MCNSHGGSFHPPRARIHRPPPRPFPGKATGRGFLDCCVTSQGRRARSPPPPPNWRARGGGGQAQSRGPRRSCAGSREAVECGAVSPEPATALPPRRQLQRAGAPRGTFTARRAFGEVHSVLREMEQRRGRALCLDRSPQRAGHIKCGQASGRPLERNYFGPLTSERKVPETAPPSSSLFSTRPASYPHRHLKRRPKGAAGQGVCRLGFQHYLYMTRNKSRAICTSVCPSAE